MPVGGGESEDSATRDRMRTECRNLPKPSRAFQATVIESLEVSRTIGKCADVPVEERLAETTADSPLTEVFLLIRLHRFARMGTVWNLESAAQAIRPSMKRNAG